MGVEKQGHSFKIAPANAFLFGLDAVSSTTSRMANGESFVPAAIKGVTSATISDTFYSGLSPLAQKLMFWSTMGELGATVALSIGQKNVDRIGGVLSGAGMYGKTQIHSKNAQTMRQRGMSMINDNGEVVRSAFGSEARAYYRNIIT